MSAHSFSVHPGRGLGPFTLGDKIREAIPALQALPGAALELRYPEQSPAEPGIVLACPPHHLELLFDPVNQRLVSITVTDPAKLRLTYQGVSLSGDAAVPTFAAVYEMLGPTFPGQLLSAGYALRYPGLSLLFPIPREFAKLYRDTDRLPLEFPDGSTPTATQLVVSSADQTGPARTPEVRVTVTLLPRGAFQVLDTCLEFGVSVQDVHMKLGRPDGECHKRVAADQLAQWPQDYLYNYFGLGLDIGLCGATHKVKKLIMHCNQPGHTDFNQYEKCHFEISIPGEPEPITPEMEWAEAEALVGELSGGRPVLNSAQTAVSPFGATKFYGFNFGQSGLILEIMNNGQIASDYVRAARMLSIQFNVQRCPDTIVSKGAH